MISNLYTSRNKGFTLLLAALVASIALTLGSALFGFAKKEIALSSINRYSHFSFFNADSATECALYWDIKGSAAPLPPFFSTSTPPAQITCEGQTVPIDYTDTSGGSAWSSSTFTFEYAANNGTPPPPNGSCAKVVVTKRAAPGNTVDTTIYAEGYNTSCNAIATSPIVLERSAELDY